MHLKSVLYSASELLLHCQNSSYLYKIINHDANCLLSCNININKSGFYITSFYIRYLSYSEIFLSYFQWDHPDMRHITSPIHFWKTSSHNRCTVAEVTPLIIVFIYWISNIFVEQNCSIIVFNITFKTRNGLRLILSMIR